MTQPHLQRHKYVRNTWFVLTYFLFCFVCIPVIKWALLWYWENLKSTQIMLFYSPTVLNIYYIFYDTKITHFRCLCVWPAGVSVYTHITVLSFVFWILHLASPWQRLVAINYKTTLVVDYSLYIYSRTQTEGWLHYI